MAIYIKGKRIYEDESFVIYSYGTEINQLTGRLVLSKHPFKIVEITLGSNMQTKSAAFGVAGKIKDYVMEYGSFPDEISKQS